MSRAAATDGAPFAAAVFAGGRSSRMGTDKARLLLRGETLLARTARTVYDAGLFAPLLVVGREREEEWPFAETVFLPDETPGLGPLGGLQTALGYVQAHVGESVPLLALGCDMPHLTPDALRWLHETVQKAGPLSGGLAVVGLSEQIEPLFSVYMASCLPRIEESIARERRSLWKLIQTGNFVHCAAPPEVAAQMVSVNTPEAWAELLSKQAQNGVHVMGANIGGGE